MPEFIDANGTVSDEPPADEFAPASESQVLAMLTPNQLVAFEPMTPDAIEETIFAVTARLEMATKVIVLLYEGVHRAEEVYQKAFSKHVINAPNQQITMAREYAKYHTADELHEVNLAKEKLRYATELQQTLTSKLYGLLNVNKSVTAMYMGGGRR